ncbi:phospho-sugar mutase [Gordonia sp. NPDC003429]
MPENTKTTENTNTTEITAADPRVAAWIAADPDPATRAELAACDADDLADRFAGTLRFGTAGLRGPVRAGPNGMNVAVVTRATAGLAAWLTGHGCAGGTVVVGRDARHGSQAFARSAAEVLAAAGFDVVALPEPLPTPLLAFACRDLRAVAGVQVTASHNPPADNGYKVYLDGGAQLVPPADLEIEALIADAGPAAAIPRRPVVPDARAHAVADRYLHRLAVRFPRVSDSPLRIALTAMHGVGGPLAVRALADAGFADVHVVPEQFEPDPDFPTVAFPNPEEPGAADRVLALAEEVDAHLAIALDPDADRCAVGIRVDGRWGMLSGDDTGALLGSFLLATTGLGEPVVASTLVSGTLLADIARHHGARHVTTLTGFKWLVRAGEPLLYAYEEAIGHCVDPDAVRDKDGISAAVAIAMLAHRCAVAGHTLADELDTLFAAHGVHVTRQRSLRVRDPGEIDAVMTRLRRHPPATLGGIPVIAEDYAERDDGLRTDAVALHGTAPDGVGVRVMARPSGTEPKLKYYIEMTAAPEVAPSATQSGTAATYPAATYPAATDTAATDPASTHDLSRVHRTRDRLHDLAHRVADELPTEGERP